MALMAVDRSDRDWATQLDATFLVGVQNRHTVMCLSLSLWPSFLLESSLESLSAFCSPKLDPPTTDCCFGTIATAFEVAGKLDKTAKVSRMRRKCIGTENCQFLECWPGHTSQWL